MVGMNWRDVSIREMSMSVRSTNCLEQNGFDTAGEVFDRLMATRQRAPLVQGVRPEAYHPGLDVHWHSDTVLDVVPEIYEIRGLGRKSAAEIRDTIKHLSSWGTFREKGDCFYCTRLHGWDDKSCY